MVFRSMIFTLSDVDILKMKNSRYWTRDEHEEFAKAWIEAAKMPEKEKAVAVCLIGQKFKGKASAYTRASRFGFLGYNPKNPEHKIKECMCCRLTKAIHHSGDRLCGICRQHETFVEF